MWSWRIGAIRGIDLKIHLTFPLILLWAAFEFGAGRANPVPFALYGSLLVLLLFGCVLLHELGHALVARALHVPVDEILLLPIGGLAKLRAMNDDPKQEFLIAVAGPLVNVGIVLLLFPLLVALLIWQFPLLFSNLAGPPTVQAQAVLFVLGRAMRGITLTGLVASLLFANVMLIIFNLIPAFPMDGGRLLRSLLAMVFSYKTATTVAVRVAQLMALLFVVWGLRGNFVLLLVALFVFLGGSGEMQRVALRDVLARGRVGTYMIRALHPLFPEWSLYAARMLAQQTGQRAFPVVEEGRLLGLLTVRELQGHAPSQTVAEAMVRDFSVLAPARTLYDAQVALVNHDHFAAAVMEEGVLLGLLSLEDIERGYQALTQQPPTVQVV